MGQWLKGRICERAAEISPDGKHLIYAVRSHARRDHWAWTAVSRVPWLKAVAFYPQLGCYPHGGLFLDNQRYWIAGEDGPTEAFTAEGLTREKEYDGSCQSRQVREGWEPMGQQELNAGESTLIFEKAMKGGHRLRKIIHRNSPVPGKPDWEEHEVLKSTSGPPISKPDWEWADVDGSTLVWTGRGALFRAPFNEDGTLGEPRMLYDFNPMKFEAIKAPY